RDWDGAWFEGRVRRRAASCRGRYCVLPPVACEFPPPPPDDGAACGAAADGGAAWGAEPADGGTPEGAAPWPGGPASMRQGVGPGRTGIGRRAGRGSGPAPLTRPP